MMVDISDLLTHIDDLLRSGGGGVFLILFSGFIFVVISTAILVISVVKCMLGVYRLLKRVTFRNGNKKVD
ncbi:hypothetical protein OWA30_004214 [Salmonella enterica]|nr:hypothetical protein [Salmonella enterica]EKE6060866.1 hypothetical protein [Salmonella enterica]